jgi:hypothetical protein
MEEIEKTRSGQGFAIAGLTLGIIAIIVSFIPCVGVLALIPGIVGIVFASVAVFQAYSQNGVKAFAMASLILSIIGTTLAPTYSYILAKRFTSGEDFLNFKHNIKTVIKDNDAAFEKSDSVDRELERKLEELEKKGNTNVASGDFNTLINDYERLLQDYIKYSKKVKAGDVNALAEFGEIQTKAVEIANKLTHIAPEMTEAQKKRFEEVQKKYNDALAAKSNK